MISQTMTVVEKTAFQDINRLMLDVNRMLDVTRIEWIYIERVIPSICTGSAIWKLEHT